MPSTSKQQQKLFGLALSVKRGETPRSEASDEVLNIVDTMSEKQIEDFASTSHEGLPKKVEQRLREIIRQELKSLNEVSNTNPFEGILTPGKKRNVGFTKILLSKNKSQLEISHSGNMGNSVKDSVNPNLKLAGIPSIEQLKKKYTRFKEEGSPDYYWNITFELK